MLSYRVIPDVPFQLVVFVSGLLAERRGEIGTPAGSRALTCWKQAVFALAWFRDRPDIPGWARASGSPRPPPTWDTSEAVSEPEDTRAIDSMDAAQMLDGWWWGPSEEELAEDEELREMFAPFGERFPGLAPAVNPFWDFWWD